MNFPCWLLSVWTSGETGVRRYSISKVYPTNSQGNIISPVVTILFAHCLVHKYQKQGWEKEQPWRSPRIARRSLGFFLPKVQNQIIWSNRDRMIQSNDCSSSSSCNVPNNLKKKRTVWAFSSPQSTCRIDEQASMMSKATCAFRQAVHWSTAEMESAVLSLLWNDGFLL